MSFPDRPVSQLLGSNGPVHALTYSAYPGTYILTGSSDRSIRLYNPEPSRSPSYTASITKAPPHSIPPGCLIQTYSAHGYEVLSLSVSSDNERFASAGGDRLVFLWDVATATTLRRLGGGPGGHTGRINAVTFAGAGDSVVASGSFDTSVRLWDLRGPASAKPIQVLSEARDSITSLIVRGPEILAGSVDGRVRRYDIRMGQCIVDTIGAAVTSIDMTKDGNGILTASLDNRIRLLDHDKGTCLKTYEAPARVNKDLRVQTLLGAKERYIISGDELPEGPQVEGIVWAWDLLSGRVVKKMIIPWGSTEPKKKVLGSDGKVKERKNVISCMAWRDNGWGDQFCVGGQSGVVTVFEQ